MLITKDMLQRITTPEDEVTPEVVARGEKSRHYVFENFKIDFSTVPADFWNWIGRLALSKEKPDEYEPPRKGLLICGPVGTGKTTLAKWIAYMFRIQFHTFQELDQAYGLDPKGFQYDYAHVLDQTTPVILDDLGAEAGFKHYGNEPVTRSLLLTLYQNWDFYGKLVVITTNMKTGENFQDSPDFITNIFGERNQSRFQKMFTTIKVLGTDRRRTA